MWIRISIGTAQPATAKKTVGVPDWTTGTVHAEDSGLTAEVKLGIERVVTVDQVHDATRGR